jgi:hypothetical protein
LVDAASLRPKQRSAQRIKPDFDDDQITRVQTAYSIQRSLINPKRKIVQKRTLTGHAGERA